MNLKSIVMEHTHLINTALIYLNLYLMNFNKSLSRLKRYSKNWMIQWPRAVWNTCNRMKRKDWKEWLIYKTTRYQRKNKEIEHQKKKWKHVKRSKWDEAIDTNSWLTRYKRLALNIQNATSELDHLKELIAKVASLLC